VTEEDPLIEEIADLVLKEMQADRTLPCDEAFKKVVDENPGIRRKLGEMKTELI
jgi:hypothetical protein